MTFTLNRLLKARKAGKSIDVPIVLSMFNGAKFWELYRWPVIRAHHMVDHEYMALSRLDVLVAHMGTNPADLILLCESIIQFEPKNLEVWDMRKDWSVSVIQNFTFWGQRVPNPVVMM